MAGSEQPADSWEDLDKLALNKLSLKEDKPQTSHAQQSAVATGR